MPEKYTDQQLQAFLDEGLTPDLMSCIEKEMRTDQQLVNRLVQLAGQREAGVHSIGEIWRRHRLSCPTRQHLGSFLLGTLEEEWMRYITFHIERIGCRVCAANLADLRAEQVQLQVSTDATQTAQLQRRRKYFQSSAGYLSRGE